MAIFKINKRKLAPGLDRDLQDRYWYFFNNERTKEEVKITFGREYITINIKAYYCVICNDLRHFNRRGLVIASKKSLDWLKAYGE